MVQKVKVNSSVELYDNRSDESRLYDIEANINIEGGEAKDMDSGNVYKNDKCLARFSTWRENRLKITFMDVEADEQNSIVTEVNEFIKDVKLSVSNQ